MNDTPSAKEPLAILGGTFDPIHYGHLRCADEVRMLLGLHRLLLLPSGQPPHRGPPQANIQQRLDMLRLAQAEFPSLEIDERETRRSGPSYMVDTLEEFRSENPGRPLVLIIGQDAANLLHTWYEWKRLFSLAHLLVLTRPGATVEYVPIVREEFAGRIIDDTAGLLSSTGGNVLHVEVSLVDVSATQIKQCLAHGQSPQGMLPPAVLQYIEENGLYQ